MADCKSCEYETMCTMPEFVRNNLKACKVYETKKKKTNADRIRAMSDEELAELLKMYVNCTCEFCVGCGSSCSEHNLKWLQSEAE